jgi:uroporphyrinogen III methyltransferase/synthase
LASSFAVVTGHSQEGSLGKIPVPNCDTLVYLMGVRNLEKIVNAVMASGRHVDTPIAIIQWGTTLNQKTLVSTLGKVVADFEKSQLASPAIIVVGAVVALREQLSWFERRPLFGQTVVITRSRTQSSSMRAALHNLGANVIEYPTIEIQPIRRNSPLVTAIQSLEQFHWIIFTSVNAVEILMEKVRDLGMDARIFHANKIAVVGSSTQAALQRYGLQADFVPSQFVAEAVLKEFPESVKGLNVLMPCAAAAREVLLEGLAALGAKITAVPVYETLQPVKQNINWRDVHWITFSSSSTVENFLAIEKIIPHHLKIGSIGPITTQTLKHFHYAPTVEGNPHTITGLVDAMAGRLC